MSYRLQSAFAPVRYLGLVGLGLAFFAATGCSSSPGDSTASSSTPSGPVVATSSYDLRADIKKMLVHRSARGHGIGAALMAEVEAEARRQGRWLLVLDTVPGENGHRLYKRAGWTQTGLLPDYAMFPDGRLCDTAIMWKRLER